MLFPKRTLIKERTQKLENGVEHRRCHPQGPFVSPVRRSQGRRQVLRCQPQDRHHRRAAPPRSELNNANNIANVVLQGWNDTQIDLENTRQDLENTRAELETTEAQLEDARTQIVQLNETIRGKDQELLEKSNLIAGLEEEKSSLTAQVADLTAQIASMQDQIAQLEEDKSVLEAQLEKCDKELNKEITMKPGTTAKIVYANAEWNFVVIDIGANEGAQAGAEMIIHRGDTMIGKIRLSAVRDNVTIAEVMPDFQKETVKEGDDVLF